MGCVGKLFKSQTWLQKLYVCVHPGFTLSLRVVSAEMCSAHRYLFLVPRRSVGESGWRQVQAERRKRTKSWKNVQQQSPTSTQPAFFSHLALVLLEMIFGSLTQYHVATKNIWALIRQRLCGDFI